MHSWLLFFHILGAAGWVGGGAFGSFLLPRLVAPGTEGARHSMEALSKPAAIYFGSASDILLLSGIGLVLTSENYGWTDLFVLIGLGAFLASGIWQGLMGKRSEQKMMEVTTPGGPEAADASRRWRLTGLVDLAIVVFALWAMVVKLGT